MLAPQYRPIIAHHLGRGLAGFGTPEPMTLEEWAAEHFYLSAESSYVEQAWSAWPFQRAILACISNDAIREVDLQKSARVGYTKMILAAVGYFAHHRRRNQALWQPADDDRDEFVKTELEPMLRDVAVMREIFPAFLARHKDNTLQAKKFLGSMLHLRGGKAAKNYRRISVDVAYLDELDAFDSDVEKEGDPVTLAAKRTEGATFPKLVCGSTPKLKGLSLIERRVELAEKRFRYHIACPECDTFHPITWGGKEEAHGFKWTNDDPETVRHLCPHCGALIQQADYLRVWEQGRYQSDDGTTISHDGVFRNAKGKVVRPPRHVAFLGVWTAYSPAVAWSDIVREFLAANEKAQTGDMSKLKAFVNTTRGEAWEQEVERTDVDEIKQRAEPYALRWVPLGGLLLLAGVDTQDNRLEVVVWAYGRGCEKWVVDHQVFFGNPAQDEVWDDLTEYLFDTPFTHETGATLYIEGAAIDSRGHNTHAVYAYAAKYARRKVFAVAGRPGREKHIKDGVAKVDIDWRGRVKRNGVQLWHVGTNHAKDLIYNRLHIPRPGPGYMHFSHELSDEFFRQMAGEQRTTKMTARGEESKWSATRKRVEAWDCTVYAVWLETHLDLARKAAKYWDQLEQRLRSQPAGSSARAATPTVAAAPAAPRPPARRTAIASDDWSSRL